MQRTLWKNSFKTIKRSWGRFLGIMLLMAVSSFSLIGLKMAGPDMQTTGRTYYQQAKLADVVITSNYGLDNKDKQIIQKQAGVQTTDFGYFQDTAINATKTSVRVYSYTSKLSRYQVVSGRLPHKNNEIALSYLLKNKYHIGQTITLKQHSRLKYQRFKVVGYVRSSEYTDKTDTGQTSVGDGNLSGFAVVKKAAFSSSVYTIARVRYRFSSSTNPFANRYQKLVQQKEQQLQKQLDRRRHHRYQSKVNKLQQAKNKLKTARAQAQQLPLVLRTSVLTKLAKQQKQLAKQEQTLKQTGYPKYTLTDRADFPGYERYQSNSVKINVLANVFPIILFAVTALVCFATMKRFVEEERIELGTLAALGYGKLAIAQKFLVYSLLACLPGILIGAWGGYYYLPRKIFAAYNANSTITNFQANFSGKWLLISLVIALLCTTCSVVVQLINDTRATPATLLVPKAPKVGARILLERISFIWNRLSFKHKVLARNLVKSKSRLLMIVCGLAGCCSLLVMGFGIRDSLKTLNQQQYSKIVQYDLLAVKKNNLSTKQTQRLNSKLKAPALKAYLGINYQSLSKTFIGADSKQSVTTLTVANSKQLTKYLALTSSTTGKQLKLTDNGVIISQKLAKLLKAKNGTTIKLKDENNKWRRFKVAGICKMYVGNYLVMNRKYYHKVYGHTAKTNAYLIKLKHHTSSNITTQAAQLIKSNALQTVNSNLNNEQSIDNIINGLNNVILILIVIGIILAVVVIYTLTNTNLEERLRELSTLKVLGFYDQEATIYVYRETIILACLGILAGFGLGTWLHSFVITNLPPANVMADSRLLWTNFALSATIPLSIIILMAGWVFIKIKTVNMLDALASVE